MSATHIKKRTTKDGEPRWIVYYRLPGGRSAREGYAGSFRSEADAQTRGQLVLGELAAGRDPRALLGSLKASPRARVEITPADPWRVLFRVRGWSFGARRA